MYNRHMTPFFDTKWHEVYLKTIGKNLNPLVYHDDMHDVIAPFVAHRTTAMLSGGREVSDYCDLVGNPKYFADVWPRALSYLEKNGLISLELFNIPESSPTYSYFSPMNKEDTTPIVSLGSSFDSYLTALPRKYRHELRRKTKKFEHGFTTHIEKSPDALQTLLNLMKLNPEKNAFLTDDMQQFFTRIAGAFTTSHIHLMTHENTPVAAVWFFTSHDTVYLYNSGYDFQNYSGAGFYLVVENIKWAIENGYKKYNFLQGSERYKYELGGKDLFVYAKTVSLRDRSHGAVIPDGIATSHQNAPRDDNFLPTPASPASSSAAGGAPGKT